MANAGKMKYEGIILKKQSKDDNKIVTSTVSKIYNILLEAEDQQDLLKSLWEFVIGEEINSNTFKILYMVHQNIEIQVYKNKRKKIISQFGYGI